MNLQAWTNSRFQLTQNLVNWAADYSTLAAARFVSQIRPTADSPVVLYEWDSAGPPDSFPDGSLVYTPDTKMLQWRAPSSDIRKVFGPDGGTFSWDFGFYLAESPKDFIRIDGGDCIFVPGVSL